MQEHIHDAEQHKHGAEQHIHKRSKITTWRIQSSQQRRSNRTVHVYIYPVSEPREFNITQCNQNECGNDVCQGQLYHCPLYPPNKFAKDMLICILFMNFIRVPMSLY